MAHRDLLAAASCGTEIEERKIGVSFVEQRDIINDALAKCRINLLEKMDPVQILDVFEEYAMFGEITTIAVRDIREERKTSDQNREILNAVRSDPEKYLKFKKALVRTNQELLQQCLEDKEVELHDAKKGEGYSCVCEQSQLCPILKDIRCPQNIKTLKISRISEVEMAKAVTCGHASGELQQKKTGPGVVTSAHKSVSAAEISGLQKHLIAMYQKSCAWVESPLVSEADDENLQQLYVKPLMVVHEERGQKGGLVHRTEQSKTETYDLSYTPIFFSKSEQCRQIYVTGDAGCGKSIFCRKLVSTWCNAMLNKKEDDDSSDDIKILSNFKLVFYITLRDSSNHYHIENMIEKQLLYNYKSTQVLPVSEILENNACLVILDGLDEWSCPESADRFPLLNPGIPGRNFINETCVFLTTTRPWKLDVLGLKTSEIDKHVELCGLSDASSKELAQKIVTLQNSKFHSSIKVNDFFEEVQKRKLKDLVTVPILLVQLILLWFVNKDLCQSQVQLYCGMLDLLLKRSRKHQHYQQSVTTSNVSLETMLPECFDDKPYCKLNKSLILALSKLAFKSLFNKKKELALVFPSTQAELYGISEADINLCLKCGILSQSKVLGICLYRSKKFSFLHKKLQEFLATLYICTCDSLETAVIDIKDICGTLDTMLEMSQILMFISGIKPGILKPWFEHFTQIVSADTRVLTYRQSHSNESLIKQIQTFIVDCIVEALNNGYTYNDLCPTLHDFVITRATISSDLERLFTKDNSVKSVYIDTHYIVSDNPQIHTILGHLYEVETLHKLYLYDPSSIVSLHSLCNTITNCTQTLTCLVLWWVNMDTLGDIFSIMCKCLNNLTSLRLMYVKLTHVQIKCFLLFVSQKHNIKQIYLLLDCTDHGRGQCRPVLDLSGLTQLQTLDLYYMSVDNFNMLGNVKFLKLGDVTITYKYWRTFMNSLFDIKQKMEVQLRYVTVTSERGTCVRLEDDLKYNDKLVVKQCEYKGNNKWFIIFDTVAIDN